MNHFISFNRCNFKRVPVLLWHGKICALYTVDCPRLRNKIKTDVYNLLLFLLLLQRTLTLSYSSEGFPALAVFRPHYL
jgi:hypothetical protein